MKIDLTFLIGNDGFKTPFDFEITQKEKDLRINANALGKVTNVLGSLQLDMRVSADLSAVCARCLGEAVEKIEFDIKEKVEDDENLKGSLLDIGNIALQNIYLNMPLRFLCRSDCKGLCSECGMDLNKGQCKCNDEAIDERLSILKKLLD
ncbi:MAG: DUF177 domain-containing protein [Firmicutes bacterium]|nr:DUF177 domain-containing protein [Bacillota bacterium]